MLFCKEKYTYFDILTKTHKHKCNKLQYFIKNV